MSPLRKLCFSVAAATVALVVLSGCAATPNSSEGQGGQAGSASEVLTDNGLAGLAGQELVDKLDATALADRPTTIFASVRNTEVIITDAAGTESSVELPADKFYVSIAPFETFSHECYFHSLTTCTGELTNTEIDVVITDQATGEVLVGETITTFDNGFIGFWLPRDIKVTVEFTRGDKSATAVLGTGPEDPTCVTTIQLT